MKENNNKALLEYLLTFISEHKQKLFHKIISDRTNHITVVLEDIYQPQNASAVLRSCDVFGVQNVHIIENTNSYNVNPKVVLGASKWVNIHKYNANKNNTEKTIQHLKKTGYRVFATSPHSDNYLIENIPLDQKVALIFGTEKEGLSEIAMDCADGFVKVPMYGFTESLNISASAAITLYELSKRLRKSTIDWHLNDQEREEQLLIWARKVIKNSRAIEERFYEKTN